MRGLAPLIATGIAAVTLREVPDSVALFGVLALVAGVAAMGVGAQPEIGGQRWPSRRFHASLRETGMPRAVMRLSTLQPTLASTFPDGRSSPDATPRSPRASPTPSGCRGRAARPRTPARSPPGTGLSGSCDGGARYACTASANHRPRRRRQVLHPTPANYPCRTLPICAPTPRGRAPSATWR